MTFVFGFDVAHSHMIGTEELIIAMYDDPEWVTDVFDTYLRMSFENMKMISELAHRLGKY